MEKAKKRLYIDAEFVFVGIIISIIATAVFVQYDNSSGIFLRETGEGHAASKIAAVTSAGTGIIGTVSVDIIDGSGRVLVTTKPFAEFDTQRSAELAVRAAERVTGRSLGNKDVLVSFAIEGGADSPEIIGGPSAGASIATAVVAAMKGLDIREDVVITGTIDENGNVGRVGGIPQKARAAAETGASLFIAPGGSGNIEYYKKVSHVERINGFTVQKVDYIPQITSLDRYVEQFGIDAAEVSHLREILPLAIIGGETDAMQERADVHPAVSEEAYGCSLA